VKQKNKIAVILMAALTLGACHYQPKSSASAVRPFAERPKNIILVIGDGFGLTQMSAMLYNNGNRSTLEAFPAVGLMKVTAYDDLITDSAASATAMACGIKTFNGAVGVDKDTLPCRTILEQAKGRGMAAGLVVTSPITHATPAAFAAHQTLRTHNEEIALDLLEANIDLLIGGGQKYFERRNDERNLVRELRDKGYFVASYFNSELSQFPKIDQRKNFFFFSADNQPVSRMQGRNYLPFAARISMPYLKGRSEKGFFLMIEGSQIDWAGHAKDTYMLLHELKDFEETIAEVFRFAAADRETLVIVTGDHECGGMVIQPGSTFKKLELEFTSNGHTAALIPVYAFGPKAELFRGMYDNTDIYFKMVEALGW
jgi:alkaline phosphatase